MFKDDLIASLRQQIELQPKLISHPDAILITSMSANYEPWGSFKWLSLIDSNHLVVKRLIYL